jgi:hypothetical protein
MSSLQLWLAVLGALVLAGLVVHGAWQTRRAGGGRAMVAQTSQMSVFREPSFDEIDTVLDPQTEPDEELLPVVTRRSVAPPRIDALIDAIATLNISSPVSGEMALAHLPTSRRAGGKPFLIEGLNFDSGEWEAPMAGAKYREFQAGVQLANRNGALNEIEYSEFVQKIQVFADAIGALPDFPDMLDVVARARELDTFASQHDAQLAMRLQPRQAAWPVGWVEQHVTRHGFVPGVTPGRLVLPSREENAPPMLALIYDSRAALAEDPAQARLLDVTLAFDVPQTPATEDPFNAWCAAGNALALALDALVSDDQGQFLRPESFPMISEELQDLYAALAERDLAAGSPAARRLFS